LHRRLPLKCDKDVTLNLHMYWGQRWDCESSLRTDTPLMTLI
jgi:hypothetical protein